MKKLSIDPAQARAGANILKFLAALLVLTLIARGTNGATLAKVELSPPERGEIVEAVEGSASVAVRDTLELTAPEGLTILEMLAGVGQTLQAGDPVARLDLEEITEKLARAEAELHKLELELAKLEKSEAADSTSLDNARRSLERLLEDYETVKTQGESDTAAAQAALEKLWDKQAEGPDAESLDSARRSLQRIREDYAAAEAQGQKDIAAAKAALETAEKSSVSATDSAALDNAQRSLNRAWEDYYTIKAEGDAAIARAQAALAAATGDEVAPAQGALDAAKALAASNQQSAWRRLEDAEQTFDQADSSYHKNAGQANEAKQAEIKRAEEALAAAQANAAANLSALDRRVEDAELALAKAEADYATGAEKTSESLLSEIKRAEEALASAQASAAANLKSAARRVEDGEIALAQAGEDYGRTSQQNASTAQLNALSAVSLRLDIQRQRGIVDELALLVRDEGMLYTDLGGVVSTAKGEGVTDKSAVVSFMDGAKGYEAKLLLTTKEAEKLAVGDECQVTAGGGSIYYQPTVTAHVSAISAPEEDGRVSVTLRLPEGDWKNGQSIKAQLVQSRSTHSFCVPLSALRSDNSGYFVYIMEPRSTVLGLENLVVRVPVTVLAKDSEQAAIQGPVSPSSQVISGSSKAIAEGDRIRVSES